MGEIYSNIFGVNRRAMSMFTNINGVWRDSTVFPNINGIYRESDSFDITEEDIIGFRIIYMPNKNAEYPDLPNLSYNPNLPARLSLTGDISGNMNMEYKGVVFEYFNTHEPDQLFDDDEEGILMYEGRLYAVLTNDLILDVTATRDLLIWDERIPESGIPGSSETWSMWKLNNLTIEIQTRILYENNGLNIEGWNKLFSTTNYIGKLNVDDTNDTNYERINQYTILPIESRDNIFYPYAEIGIARDLHTVDRNMVGSYGVLDHTFNWITVNGVKKPFVCEIYN